MNDQEFVLSGSKSQQLREVVKQLRQEGKVVLVVKPGSPIPVLDCDFVFFDEPATYWEGTDFDTSALHTTVGDDSNGST